MDLGDPTSAAILCADALGRAGLEFALYGGLVLAAYGEPRETRDVDVAVADVDADRAHQALARAGLAVTVAFDHVTFGGVVVGRVTLLGGEPHLGLNTLDLVRPRSARYARATLARAEVEDLLGHRIPIVAPEDYVILKALATRDRDLDDASSVLRRSGDLLDLTLIDREVHALSLELPDWPTPRRWLDIRARAH